MSAEERLFVGAATDTSYGVAFYAFINGVVGSVATFVATNLVAAIWTGGNFSFWGFIILFGFAGGLVVAVATGAVSVIVALTVLKGFRRSTPHRRALLAASSVFAGLGVLAVITMAVLDAWYAWVILVLSFTLTSVYVYYATLAADRANSLPQADRPIF